MAVLGSGVSRFEISEDGIYTGGYFENIYMSGVTADMNCLATSDYVVRYNTDYGTWSNLATNPNTSRQKCQYCGQWGETHSACTHCGGAVD